MANHPATFRCCGVDVAALNLDEAVAHLRVAARSGGGCGVHLCNAYTLSLASRDDEYRKLLDLGRTKLADGTPVAWVGRRRGHSHLIGPVRGPTLMLELLRDGVSWGARHYFYGSRPEVVGLIGQRLPHLVPGASVVGLESPPFRQLTRDEEESMVQRIRDARPHFVWVGLGTPRQDQYVSAFAEQLGAVTIGVGAAFEFLAGTVSEAPRWMHGSGLEWLYRLYREPRRLWRRYLVGNTRFISRVAYETWTTRKR